MITSKAIKEIQSWTDEKFNKGKIGWPSEFYDLETLKEYRKFFKTLDENIKILAIYFSEPEKDELLKEFKIEGEDEDSFGLETMLSKQIEETEKGKTIGYDLIGVEFSGDFHTFYCHNMAEELINNFGLKINEYGLLEDYDDWGKITEYMNDNETACEPVPWFYIKVKLFE